MRNGYSSIAQHWNPVTVVLTYWVNLTQHHSVEVITVCGRVTSNTILPRNTRFHRNQDIVLAICILIAINVFSADILGSRQRPPQRLPAKRHPTCLSCEQNKPYARPFNAENQLFTLWISAIFANFASPCCRRHLAYANIAPPIDALLCVSTYLSLQEAL